MSALLFLAMLLGQVQEYDLCDRLFVGEAHNACKQQEAEAILQRYPYAVKKKVAKSVLACDCRKAGEICYWKGSSWACVDGDRKAKQYPGGGGGGSVSWIIQSQPLQKPVRQWKEDCNTCTEWSNGVTSCTLAMCLTQEQIYNGTCTGECMTHVWPTPKTPEPEDVPAVQVINGNSYAPVCQNCLEMRWTCADRSRILLTAEDGTRWCHRVQP